jgi:hypothetical protein
MAGCPHPGAELETLHAARDYVSGESFEVVRCRRCTLMLTSPAPAPDRIASYYRDEY